MKKFVIEREIPNIGSLTREQVHAAATESNSVLRELGSDIQWLESYIAADRMFCVYLGKDEAIIRKHAEISGFPASRISEIGAVIDTTNGD